VSNSSSIELEKDLKGSKPNEGKTIGWL